MTRQRKNPMVERPLLKKWRLNGKQRLLQGGPRPTKKLWLLEARTICEVRFVVSLVMSILVKRSCWIRSTFFTRCQSMKWQFFADPSNQRARRWSWWHHTADRCYLLPCRCDQDENCCHEQRWITRIQDSWSPDYRHTWTWVFHKSEVSWQFTM